MKAIGFTEFGDPSVLQEYEVPTPTLGANEVRVRVCAAAVNPTDTLRRAGARADEMKGQPTPYVVGMDFAGVVAEVGSEAVTDVAVGDQVMGIVVPHGHNGAYAEQVIVPPESIVKMPGGCDFAAASTLPMNGLTARLTLDRLGLESGQVVAVTGAAGIYGGYVIQLAKSAGVTVIADAAPEDRALVQQLGADHVVDRGPDVATRIREVIPEGVDALADGAVLDEAIVGAVRDGGAIATLRFFEGVPHRGIIWHPITVYRHAREQRLLRELRTAVEAGELTLRVADTYPSADAAVAHRRLEQGGVRGRIVLQSS